jgi:hypothetical protein
MINFFTIVQNGMPFIKHHIETFNKLSMPWHWHICEGLAELKADTGWSVARGGRIVSSMHDCGLSIDGTTEYLSDLSVDRWVSLYLPPKVDQFWPGKCAMCNTVVDAIKEPCLLWQIDVDEFWTVEQIEHMHQMFQEQPHRTAAWFWCRYYVGRDLMLSTRNCYANNPAYEWIRVWNFKPGMRFAAHEPPVLKDPSGADVARINPFMHAETEAAYLVFKHYAYCIESQLTFKEIYYGYNGALCQWRRLQNCTHFPVRLGDFLPWVGDNAQVIKLPSALAMPF